MAALPTMSAIANGTPKRCLLAIGTCGTLFALVILGTSMLLRLATIFGVDGHTISTLPASVESAIRLAHRLSASGVGLLAIFAIILRLTRKDLPAQVVTSITWIVAVTIVLALIGPLTPGYRHAAVTVGNVAGGMVLLMAFFWLRESVRADIAVSKPVEPLLRATIVFFLVHIATGAGTSAYEMHGVRWVTFLHMSTALLSTSLIGASLWERRDESTLGNWTAATTVFLVIQIALGVVLLWTVWRPIWLAFGHGMVSPMLAIALVSFAVRDGAITHRRGV